MPDDEDQKPDQLGLIGVGLSGPYLAVAVLCEKVLREADGVLSIIRVVDRITVSASHDQKQAPAQMPVVPINLIAVLSFKSGFARGPYIVKIRSIDPSHRELNAVELPILLEGEDRGANLVINLGFQAQEEGLYWFEVFLMEALITKMPLRVLYQRIAVS